MLTTRRMRPRTRSWSALVVTAMVFALTLTVTAQAHTKRPSARGASIKPGAWTQLGTSQGGTTPTLLHLKNGRDLAVWEAPQASSKFHYEYGELKTYGGMSSKPKDVFGGNDWDGLAATPVLVADKGKPVLVLEGARGGGGPFSQSCIVGDVLSPHGWQLQTWSLSASCHNPDHYGAAATAKGTLSAAWPGGWVNGNGIQYRIGVSPSIPAATPDQHVSTVVGDAGNVGEATETKTQHIFAAWTRFFSKPASKDGLWVADLTKKSAAQKAPDTGTNLVASFPEPVAVASPSVRGGIYLAYCNNSSPCSRVELWKYGAKKAVRVPDSSKPRTVAISAGPSGRLWIAWWSSVNGTVGVVRTNKAGTAFGPVETYAGPHGCKSDGIASIRISSGAQQRLDVVVNCFDFAAAHGANHVSATQSLVPLRVVGTRGIINHKKGGKVTYRVSDVGDAVQGAKVGVDGRKGTTDKKGQVTFHFPKGAKTGKFKVMASMANYRSATTSLVIS